MNPTAIAIDVDDSMDKDTIVKRLQMIERFEYDYVGQKLKLDLVAVRSTTDDPKQFAKTVQTVIENTHYPLILCSLKSTVIEAGLNVLSLEYRSLIYAATKENWRDG